MSNEFYPVSLIQKLRVTKQDRTIRDPFEDGSSGARRTWPAGYFKRRFEVTHSPLTRTEFNYLKEFYETHGTYGTFYFRDNVNQDGNALVRFAEPLLMEYQGAGRPVTVRLEETTAYGISPATVAAVAGATPVVWYDSTREMYYAHAGTTYYGATANAADRLTNYTSPWQAGTPAVTSPLADGYTFDGTLWAKTSANISQLSGTAPDMTIFLLARISATTSIQMLASVSCTGIFGNPNSVGIGLTDSGSFYPLESITSGFAGDPGIANSPADTWKSVALAGWSSPALYVNAVSGGTGPFYNSRDYVAGPFAIGCSTLGTKIANPGNAMANCDIAHCMLFASKLTAAQVKALHNLFVPDFTGLAHVA
ncbi:MAG: hypothetical protein H7Y43_00220 [Akkermansiaceae bacterium]|nr:hypothetical protein [Verrucomicrobiales bacterium]